MGWKTYRLTNSGDLQTEEFIHALEALGYDGMIFHDMLGRNPFTSYVVFDNSAIHSGSVLTEGQIDFEPEDGCWILPDGSIIACDRINDLHHLDIAERQFGSPEDDEYDYGEGSEYDYFVDSDPLEVDAEPLQAAFEAGWIRVGQIGNTAYAQLPARPSRKALLKLVKVAKHYTGYEHYSIEPDKGSTQNFVDHKSFMVGISRLG